MPRVPLDQALSGSQPTSQYRFQTKAWRQNGGYAKHEKITEYIERLTADRKKHLQEVQEYQAKLQEARANFEATIADLQAFAMENEIARSERGKVFRIDFPDIVRNDFPDSQKDDEGSGIPPVDVGRT